MSIYRQFRKMKIDHAAIELGLCGAEETYFCTPKGARIIGSAGVDGIHYCFVRGHGEMVFAVNPSNTPGENVFPIARTFEDLLRLLMACGSMAALEQAHQWDEEQFEEYVAQNQPAEAAQAVLAAISEKFGMTAMEAPFAYLKQLQDSFYGGDLTFSKEYDALCQAADQADTPAEWRVTLEGGFYPKRGRPGREIAVHKQFEWGDEIWHVPAVYLCSRGWVIDFCIQVNEARLKAFFHQYRQLEEKAEPLSEGEQEDIQAKNPAHISFHPQLIMNGKPLRCRHGHGQTWISSDILGEDSWEDRCGGEVLAHYGLDRKKAWVIHRFSFEGEGGKDGEIQSLSLFLERAKTRMPGLCFETPAVGGQIAFSHPLTGTEHLLTVQALETEETAEERFHDAEFEFPRHLAAMTYTIYPPLAQTAFSLKDRDRGDQPRPKKADERGRTAMSVGVIGVIRSAGNSKKQADVSNNEEIPSYVACSSLHFEPIHGPIVWRLDFMEKMMADIQVRLI